MSQFAVFIGYKSADPTALLSVGHDDCSAFASCMPNVHLLLPFNFSHLVRCHPSSPRRLGWSEIVLHNNRSL